MFPWLNLQLATSPVKSFKQEVKKFSPPPGNKWIFSSQSLKLTSFAFTTQTVICQSLLHFSFIIDALSPQETQSYFLIISCVQHNRQHAIFVYKP